MGAIQFFLKVMGMENGKADEEKKVQVEELLLNVMEDRAAEEHPAVRFIRRKISPLNLDVRDSLVPRVNVLIGIIDFKYFFGGYISVFSLAKRLALAGYPVRIIVTEECYFEPMEWCRRIRDYEGLEDFFDCVEVVYAPDRKDPIPCHPQDAIVATSCWSAHIAHLTMRALAGDRFIYLSQEYEPIFYELGSLHVLSRMSYDLPHYGIFSTKILMDYHRRNRIGLFRESTEEGEKNSVAFENAILRFDVSEEMLRERPVRRLVFYARPETHAARNCFELGMLALSGAISEGAFQGNWEFYGIGSLQSSPSCILIDEAGPRLNLLPKMSLNEYRDLLPHFDVGLSLMLSPHPSLVPLEMAAAGIRVVTNTFANKTVDVLKGISTNLIPADPTVEGIREGLVEAVAGVEDWDGRIQGSQVRWPQDWDVSFDGAFLEKMKGFIGWEPPLGAARQRSSAASAGDPDLEPPAVVRSLVKLIARQPDTFVYRVSREDEMYLDSLGHVGEDEALWWYFKSGLMSFETIQKIVAASQRRFEDVGSFLDFACGYGRVSRFLVQVMDPQKIWVSDIYQDAVRFQERCFGVNGFFSRTEPSEVRFPGKFEIVYVGSLFSHLPAARFEEWLIRLYGLLEDEGVLILSTHSEKAIPPGVPFAEDGFTFIPFSESRSLSKEEYGSTYVRKDWFERLASRLGMTNLTCMAEELCEQQDIYVLSKRYIPALSTLVPTFRPVGSIDTITITDDQTFYMRGWAADRQTGAPVKQVMIYCDGSEVGEAALGYARTDVRDYFQRDEFVMSGWEFEGRPPVLNSQGISLREGIIVKVTGWGGEIGYLNGMGF